DLSRRCRKPHATPRGIDPNRRGGFRRGAWNSLPSETRWRIPAASTKTVAGGTPYRSWAKKHEKGAETQGAPRRSGEKGACCALGSSRLPPSRPRPRFGRGGAAGREGRGGRGTEPVTTTPAS